MNLYKFHTKSTSLNHHDLAHNHVPRFAWKDGMSKEWYRERENMWAKSAAEAYLYAFRVLKGPFPEGEEVIAKDAHRSFYYATDVVKGRFPKGEDAMATDTYISYEYAVFLNAPFPKGEDAIAKDAEQSAAYAMYILKARFPKGEKEIASVDDEYKDEYEDYFGIKL